MTLATNKAVLQKGSEHFNEPADRSSWLAAHSPAVVAWGLGPEPLDFQGLGHFYQGLWNAFPDLHITVDDMIGEGDTIAWRLTVTGTHQSEFRGVPPTGREVTFGAQYFFRFEDGKIVERWTNFDRLGVLIQIGAIPAPV